MRNKAERRKNDWNHIVKKQKIIKYCYGGDVRLQDFKNELHRLSKGKVHCSCPLCATKTKKDGYSHSDLKKLAAAADQEIE